VLKEGRIELGDCIQGAFAEAAAAASVSFELLDYEDFSADAASYTFTPASALTADNYSQFIIAISGKTDAVNAIPTIIFSASASNIYATGATIAGNGTRTALAVSGVAPLSIGNATTIPSANINFTCLISMTINPTANYLTGYMTTMNVDGILSEQKWFEVSASNISSVEIEMSSTGKFKADTRFAIYGLKTS